MLMNYSCSDDILMLKSWWKNYNKLYGTSGFYFNHLLNSLFSNSPLMISKNQLHAYFKNEGNFAFITTITFLRKIRRPTSTLWRHNDDVNTSYSRTYAWPNFENRDKREQNETGKLIRKVQRTKAEMFRI